jgi:hypothetical protein
MKAMLKLCSFQKNFLLQIADKVNAIFEKINYKFNFVKTNFILGIHTG